MDVATHVFCAGEGLFFIRERNDLDSVLELVFVSMEYPCQFDQSCYP